MRAGAIVSSSLSFSTNPSISIMTSFLLLPLLYFVHPPPPHPPIPTPILPPPHPIPPPRSTAPRFVGPYTTLSPELSFVVEDSKGVCGYVLATLDSAEFYDRFLEDWLPSVISKYPKPPSSTVQSNPEQVSRELMNNRPYLAKI